MGYKKSIPGGGGVAPGGRVEPQEQRQQLRRIARKVVHHGVGPRVKRVRRANLTVEGVVGVNNLDDRPVSIRLNKFSVGGGGV